MTPVAKRQPARKGPKKCRDCLAEGRTTRRAATYPGPRCATHWRQTRRQRSDATWERHIRETYNLEPEDYWKLYDAQGGRCYICRRGTGRSKRLSIDHDHSCCPGPTSCGKCIRGLLDTSCNRNVLGHLRDDPEALQRAIDYLASPPARAVLERR